MTTREGVLFVTMAPDRSTLPDAKFHDWYMNEHGPMRLRLSDIFRTGFRYRAIDLGVPGLAEWMAVYDVGDMGEMIKEPYINLRKAPVQSQREGDTMAEIDIDREFFDLKLEWKSANWTPLESLSNEGQDRVMMSETFYPYKKANPDEVMKWIAEVYVPYYTKLPGWLRTRCFATSTVEPTRDVHCMVLHELETENGWGETQYKIPTSIWTTPRYQSLVDESRRRVYTLYYTFGPAPRDLASLCSPDTDAHTSTDGKTRTSPASSEVPWPAIESYITTPDGVEIPYRLEGSGDPDAPLLVLSNSILTEWGIWDYFVSSFLSKQEKPAYRILRYHTRGRYSECGSQPINVDVLAGDIISLLDALRVKTVKALIGVSMGGCTVLNAAMKYPERVASFITCDSASSAVPGNDKAWKEREAVATKQGAVSSTTNETIIGSELAELTVRRWFTKESYEDATMVQRIERVRDMVERNSLEGFKASVQTLFSYDMSAASEASTARAMFLVGAGDGALPGVMEKMAEAHGRQSGATADFRLIEKAGHLPMVENTESFVDAVEAFLNED